MNLKKTAVIAAAAGALAAISVPAMAFENEFHGMYKLKYFVTNSEAGGSSYIFGASAPTTVGETRVNNYFEQRARLQYIAKASDDLKLVTQFEIDSVFGDRAQGGIAGSGSSIATSYNGAFRGSGGALESDAVNLETKHVYLDFKIPSTPTRVTAGIQAVKDPIKGIFLDADVAGINTVSKMGAATVALGYWRAYDQSYLSSSSPNPRGVSNLDLLTAYAGYAVNKDINLGAFYTWYGDSRNAAYLTTGAGTVNIHVLALNGEAKIGKATLSGFAAHQQGSLKTNVPGGHLSTAGTTTQNGNQEISAWAFNAAVKVPVGPGNLRTAVLYTTGDDGRDGINTSWQAVTTSPNRVAGTAANSYNESGMMLLNRNAAQGGTSTDMSIAYTTDNRQQGMTLATIGYDANITPKLYANTNLGFLWANKVNGNKPVDFGSGIRGGTAYQGMEINEEIGYKMYDNLTASVQGAFVWLGGYYENTATNHAGLKEKPDNPFTIRTVLSYAF